MPKKSWIRMALFCTVAVTLATLVWQFSRNPEPLNQEKNQTKTSTSHEAKPQPPDNIFNKSTYSISEPDSIWVVVNKKNPLPSGFAPDDLVVPSVRLRLSASEQQMQIRKVTEPKLIEMFEAAKIDGVILVFGSGYRSEALQRQFYNNYVAQDGQAAADRYSARPGTSEHQTGLSFDATSPTGACHLEICFQNTPQGKWLAANAHKYGFIIRYPDGKESITGYQYEPWHLRYVGTELAAEMKKRNINTLEEFFELPPAPNY